MRRFSVILEWSAVAGAVYFTKCRASAGAGCDKSCVRKADAGAECGEFIFHGCGLRLRLRMQGAF